MNREEFIERCEKYAKGKYPEFTDSQYEIIEKVYTFHPAIDAVLGKEQIAKLFVDMGIGVIKAMLPAAIEWRHKDTQMRSYISEIERLRAELKILQDEHDEIKKEWKV